MTRFLFLLLFVLPTILLHGQSSSTKVKVYWDTSLSMEQRDLEKEIDFIEQYTKENKINTIVLVEFSNGIKKIEDFENINTSWNGFTSYLKQITYEGISDMNFLLNEDNQIPSMLFTDGYPTINELKVHYGKSKMDVICSLNKCNSILNRLSLYSAGSYFNLGTEARNSFQRGNSKDFKVFRLSGMIKDANGPLEDVTVILKASEEGTLTRADGKFSINVVQGDSIQFQFIGKQTQIYPVDFKQKFLNIFLKDEVEALEEIVLVKKVADNAMDKSGTKGYAVQVVEKEDMNVSSASLNQSLAGKVSGVQTNEDGFSRSIIRGFSSITYTNYPLIIVDGAPMPRANYQTRANVNSDIMEQLNPNDIVSVKVLKGLAATNKYGGAGSNGVILITTISGDQKFLEGNSTDKRNSALLRNNNYSGALEVSNKLSDTSYLKELLAFETLGEAYEFYLKQRGDFFNDPYYFINIHTLFAKTDIKLAEDILNSALALAKNKIPVLRTIAFYHQEAGRYKQASQIFDKIIKLDSSKIQSYRDLANSYIQSGNFKKGFQEYVKLIDADFELTHKPKTINDIVDLELKNLVYRKGKELDLSTIPSRYKVASRFDARIVLEWSDSEAEFEVDYISPDRKISKWSHTINENKERMKSEKLFGYHMEQSLMSQVQKGDWFINVRTYNLKDWKPLYLKCTVYYYYGQAGQYTTEEVFMFDSGNQERVITKIIIR